MMPVLVGWTDRHSASLGRADIMTRFHRDALIDPHTPTTVGEFRINGAVHVVHNAALPIVYPTRIENDGRRVVFSADCWV
jgi:hypothetical protein